MTYVYQAVRRNKENQHNNRTDRKQYWEVVYDLDLFEEQKIIDSIKRRVSHLPGVWRIYRSVNKRDLVKSKLEMLEVLTRSLVYPDNRKIETMWRTILMQPRNKAERLFLLDIDTRDIKLTELESFIGREIIHMVKTPNGYHGIVEPFDPRLVENIENVEVKKDAFLFREIFEVKDEALHL